MNKITGIFFSIIYLVVAYFLAVLISIHGPGLIIQVAVGLTIIAITILWYIYFFTKRRSLNHKTAIFLSCALGIGILLVGAIIASSGLLVDLEVYRSKKHATDTEVFSMKDETLFSPKGNPIGIRLRYSMRFPDSNYFWESPSMNPEKYLGISIWADMRMENRDIKPPMIGTDPLRYEQGKTYNFIVDMLPYFVIQNADKTKLCIMNPPQEYEDSFKKLIQTNEIIHYNIRISGTKFSGFTTNTYNPKEFYDSAIKEGAFECQENQTIYF